MGTVRAVNFEGFNFCGQGPKVISWVYSFVVQSMILGYMAKIQRFYIGVSLDKLKERSYSYW